MREEIHLPTPETVKHQNIETIFNARGSLLSAKTRNRTYLDQCIKEGYLDEHHAEYAMKFLGLRLAWMAPVSYKPSSLCREVNSYFDGTAVHPADVFDLIYKQIGLNNCNIIIYICNKEWKDTLPPLYFRYGEACRKAFDALVAAMDKVRNGHKKPLD